MHAKFQKVGLIACALIACNQAKAEELKWTHYGVRPLGMGNAFVAVADDYNALFYNPAGLARLNTWSLELINPSIGVSKNTLSAINDVNGLMNGSTDSSGTNAVNTALSTFQALEGKNQYLNVGWTPHLIFPGFGIGIGVDLGGTIVVHHQVSADVDAGISAIIPVSYARSMLEDRLSLGATVKGVFTSGVNREFSIADLTAFTKQDSSATTSDEKKLKDYVVGGKGVGVDLGMLFTPVKTMEPTLGVSISDLGGTPYASAVDENLGKPKPRQPSVNTGVSLKPYMSNGSYLLTAIDVHAVNQPIHFSKKVNFGSEYGLGKVLKLQAGLHQGELSGGVQLDAWLLILRFATYAEQIGPTASEQSDRRYVAQLKMLL